MTPLLLALLLASGPAKAPAPAAETHRAAAQALSLLEEEQVEEARALVEPLLASHPADPAVQAAAGVLLVRKRTIRQSWKQNLSGTTANPAPP